MLTPRVKGGKALESQGKPRKLRATGDLHIPKCVPSAEALLAGSQFESRGGLGLNLGITPYIQFYMEPRQHSIYMHSP